MTVAENFKLLKSVNDCQIEELKEVARTYDVNNCGEFYRRVRNTESAVIHTYQITAYASLEEADPKNASDLWKQMVDFCDSALKILRELKERFPNCGASEVYNTTLDYRSQAHKRYIQNLEDAECQRTIPKGLFP
jgi:hypothetical protein